MDNPPIIYADYQATTPVDARVQDRMAPFWSRSFGNAHSNDHAFGWRAAEAVRAATDSVAALIGADRDEIIFTSGATEANNLALFGLALRRPPRRNRILVSTIEHKCVLASARALAVREGLTVETIPVNNDGTVDVANIQARVDDDVLVVAVMAVNNEIGTVQDIADVSAILAPHGIPLHCDAAQAPCATDTRELARHAQFVSLSGHKMYGPQGIGALCIQRDLQSRIEPLIHGGGQQSGLRSGTLPLPLCVGMGEAAALLQDSESVGERTRIARQRDLLRDSLGPESRHAGDQRTSF